MIKPSQSRHNQARYRNGFFSGSVGLIPALIKGAGVLLLTGLSFSTSAQQSSVFPAYDPARLEELSELAIAQVPPKVMQAARAAAPDVYFQSAQRFWKDDFLVYRIQGRLFREVWHLHIRQDGEVLRTESDFQDDENSRSRDPGDV
ncbi:MAG: hypothetical protein AAF662_04225 [Pseudomonadota bacterium]